MEEFIKLEESHLKEIANLYQRAFMGEPWNDDWSDNTQLEEYIKDVSCYFAGINYGLVKDGIFLQTDEDKPSYRFYTKNNFKTLPVHVSLYKNVQS